MEGENAQEALLMQRIEAVNPRETTGRTKDLLNGLKKEEGRVPNVFATMANAPAVLEAYLSLVGALKHTSIDAKLRELVAVSVSSLNECEYCLSAHTAAGKKLQVPEKALRDAQDANSEDSRTREALHFAKTVADRRGRVTDSDLQQLKAAGFGDAQALEIMGVVVATIFTNYMNHVAGTEIDFPKVAAPMHH